MAQSVNLMDKSTDLVNKGLNTRYEYMVNELKKFSYYKNPSKEMNALFSDFRNNEDEWPDDLDCFLSDHMYYHFLRVSNLKIFVANLIEKLANKLSSNYNKFYNYTAYYNCDTKACGRKANKIEKQLNDCAKLLKYLSKCNQHTLFYPKYDLNEVSDIKYINNIHPITHANVKNLIESVENTLKYNKVAYLI